MMSNSSLWSPQIDPEGDTDPAGEMDSVTNMVLILLYFLIIVVGTTGNGLVIWIAGFRLAPTVTNVWLVNLAVADLAFSLSRVLSLLQRLVYGHWPFGLALCKFNGLLKYANMFCSVLLLSVISLDRALCVWWPILAKRRRTLAASRLMSITLWTLSISLSLPYCTIRIVQPDRNNLSKCSTDPEGKKAGDGARMALYGLRFLCGFLIPFLLILSCYILAALGLRRTRLAGKSKPLKVLVCLVTAFFLCWGPYHGLLLAKLVNNTLVVRNWLRLAKGLAYLNSCVNPLLYFCMGLDQRRRFKQSLLGVCRRALEEDGEGPPGPAGDQAVGQSLGHPAQMLPPTV